MKKLLLGLGAVATVVAPIVAVVSCADEKPKSHSDIVQAKYDTGQDSTKLMALVTAFNSSGSAADYNAIMDAISQDDTGGLIDSPKFALVGDILTKTLTSTFDGKQYTTKTVYHITHTTQ